MVSSYPLPEGFSEFDVFSLGSCLMVEGESLSAWKAANEKAPWPLTHAFLHTLQLPFGCLFVCFFFLPCAIVCRKCVRAPPRVTVVIMCVPSRPSTLQRSDGLLLKRGHHRRFPQSEGAEDPQQFPRLQFSHGRHGHLHERHHCGFLQFPQVS